MPANTQAPLAIFEGQRNQVRIITKSHGIIRPNLVDGFDFTPKFSNKRVQEFDNPVDALTYTTFDGGSGKISYLESNQGQIIAALMDLDPTVAVQMLNPTGFQPFDVFMNMMGQDGLVKGCALLYACTPTSNPFSQTVKEAAKRSIDFECLNGIFFPGLAIQYTRGRGATIAQATPVAPTLTTNDTGGFLSPDTYYAQIAAVTAVGETIISQEQGIHVPAGTSTNTVSVETPAIVSPVTGYKIYFSNRSNGERYSTTCSSGTTTVISALPSATAARPQYVNGSGSFVAIGDKTFAGSGPYTITLDNAAYTHPQTGLQYGLIKKDSFIVATVDNPATLDTFLFNAAGTSFSVNADPAAQVWELVTFYQP